LPELTPQFEQLPSQRLIQLACNDWIRHDDSPSAIPLYNFLRVVPLDSLRVGYSFQGTGIYALEAITHRC
jgi:hypothetical protein